MVHHALGKILDQHGTGVDADTHVELGCFVHFLPAVLGAVHEEPTDDAFPYVCILVVLVDGKLGVGHVDLDTLE